MKKTMLSLAIACGMLMTGCSINVNSDKVISPCGKTVSSTVELGDYDQIQVHNMVAVVMSDTVSAPRFVGDSVLAGKLRLTIEDGNLVVGFGNNVAIVGFGHHKDCATLYLPTNRELKSVDLSGASSIDISDTVKVDDFALSLSGASSAKMILDMEEGNVEVSASGASSVSMAGRVKAIALDLSGASDFNASGLMSKSAEVSLSGASNAEIGVEKILSGSLSGASDLIYYGKPKCEVSASGGSEIIAR